MDRYFDLSQSEYPENEFPKNEVPTNPYDYHSLNNRYQLNKPSQGELVLVPYLSSKEDPNHCHSMPSGYRTNEYYNQTIRSTQSSFQSGVPFSSLQYENRLPSATESNYTRNPMSNYSVETNYNPRSYPTESNYTRNPTSNYSVETSYNPRNYPTEGLQNRYGGMEEMQSYERRGQQNYTRERPWSQEQIPQSFESRPQRLPYSQIQPETQESWQMSNYYGSCKMCGHKSHQSASGHQLASGHQTVSGYQTASGHYC